MHDQFEANEEESGPEQITDDGAEVNARDIVPANQSLPDVIPIIPLNQRPIFPGLTIPIQFGHDQILPTLRSVAEGNQRALGLVFAKDYNEERPLSSELFEIGTAAVVIKMAETGEGTIHVLIQSLRRFKRVKDEGAEDGVLRWRVEYYEDASTRPDQELKAYTTAIITSVKELLKRNPLFAEQLKMLLASMNIEQPGLIMDLVASMTTASGEKLQTLLETVPLIQRAERLMVILEEELQLLQLQEKIKNKIEERISKQQKEFFLREQLKEIKKELGLEKDEKTTEIEGFQERLEKRSLSEESRKVVEQEIQKLRLLEPVSPEYNVSRNYVDWLTLLPWGIYSEDSFEVARAREVLDRDHYGLTDVKDRILEFISTGFKTGRISGSVLCFVGPPGVGKTSIGHSVAEALNRKFFRFSLGGMRDEAEIKGHRRTYIGAMPGKFIQSLKTVGTSNPVIMLDEIDKIGASFQGDPASSLLEVLDPAQNSDFLDHYLDVRFDLSRVLFIATANQLDTIPSALLDRMEIIKLSGYILEEKFEIARRYLIPRALEEHGLKAAEIEIMDEAVKEIIDRYAREAGVRSLENRIKKIMRRMTRRHAEGNTAPVRMTRELVEEFLGPPAHTDEVLYERSLPGVVTGLAWTSLGGATLHVEAAALLSKSPGYKQTGQLGDVMQESAEIAYTYIRSRAAHYEIPADYFQDRFLHLHVPAGATPKDGPSAGITMALALYSLAKNKPVPRDVAMTGELTLTGNVLPIGGVKEKIIAARRRSIARIILPRENLRDYKELPEHLRAGLRVYFVTQFDDVLRATYEPGSGQGKAEIV